MHNTLTLTVFAKQLNFKRANDKEFRDGLAFLERVGALKVEQSGFLADSMHHQKIITIVDWNAIKSVFKSLHKEPKTSKHHHHIKIYEYTCASPLIICSSRRRLKRQGVVCVFPSSCNQKRYEL